MTIKEVIKSNLCIGCGICTIDKETEGMIYSHRNDCFIPKNHNLDNNSLANVICPGKGYSIVQNGKDIFQNSASQTEYDIDLGYYRSFSAVRSLSYEVLDNASSGGVMTETLLYLLRKKIVDKVSVTTFQYSPKGINTKSYLTSNEEDIMNAQGSKYCPVNLESLINELQNFNGTVAIVAVPCSIAAIRNIIKQNPKIFLAKIKFFISNFCGGHKSYKNISRLAELHNIEYHNIEYFRFRGGGQPGSLKFIDNKGKTAQTSYPKYVGMTGDSKMLRCHLCVDATGELADMAFGDAWIPRFEETGFPWSVIICRNKKSEQLISSMLYEKIITSEQVTIEELKRTQRFNLKSKKNRQLSRMKLYKILGYKVPAFEGGYHLERTSMKTEIEIYIKHSFKLFLEKIGAYSFIYNKIKK